MFGSRVMLFYSISFFYSIHKSLDRISGNYFWPTRLCTEEYFFIRVIRFLFFVGIAQKKKKLRNIILISIHLFYIIITTNKINHIFVNGRKGRKSQRGGGGHRN